ncbi:lipopolysaccharide heptosyltransferase I [Sulfuricella denitrificans skB26]|uniref:Lipopolysaccharide heptosyltransferase 1 n=1 Tax=Sulfuricella denitrificans (strain DSM 22764 / NBRC 105220 / skB26) TaxID=1163617 RepID=S6ABF8_SULDS|nr:lipopolysaccharide heptosyltransferase I [Sulfuricella denitrificans]BAN36715.1 lipopolysaccharide heptosyltransferase I [Sulfuricella denitrificans skB26]
MPKILLVKTSSMGDVIHNLPVVSDIRAHFPEAEIDWVVEESFAGIPALHPGMGEIIPVAVRRWRKNLFSRTVHAEISIFIKHLRNKTYDVILDTQGLIKSAIITRLAQGAHCGFDWQSAREPLAALFYDKTLRVEKNQPAVMRNRLLAGRALGYSPDDPVNYGIAAPSLVLPWLPTTPFVVLLHATSRDDKLWPEADWIALGTYLASKGIACVLPWGSAAEQLRSQRLAEKIALSVVPPALTLGQAATLLSLSIASVGVDTGLVHLAAALTIPTIAIYCASDPGLTGLHVSSGQAINLGRTGTPPDTANVINALNGMVAL